MKAFYQDRKTKTVNLAEEEVKRITIEFLLKKFNLQDRFINKSGELVESIEYHTSHSYFVNTVIGEATDLDEAVFKVIKALK